MGMKYLNWVVSLFAGGVLAQAAVLPVVQDNGQACVSAARLERDAAVAVKSLPGENQFVACARERCARVTGFKRNGGVLVTVASLAQALDAKAEFDEAGQNVRFEFSSESAAPSGAVAGVGRLAPDFRLQKLDGTWVALSDFRGKRVLINSWASW